MPNPSALTINQTHKHLIWDYYQTSNQTPQDIPKLTQNLIHPDIIWHGPHPFRKLQGHKALIGQFWQPLLHAIPDMQRRPYHFIGGVFEGWAWVASTGDFIGTFVRDWIGIPATGTSVHMRYGEFHCLDKGHVVETRMLLDILELTQQAGFSLAPPSSGKTLWIPGPLAGDGVCLEPQDSLESQKSLALIESMIFQGLNKYDQQDQDSQDLVKYWHPHMVWHGPVGVGSAYGLEAFKQKAQGPIVHAFPDRKGAGHKARIAEGCFAASTGWPSLVGTHQHAFMGWPATQQRVGWNIMDFWKREGDMLLENWVLIDLVDAALQSGVDLLSQLAQQRKEQGV